MENNGRISEIFSVISKYPSGKQQNLSNIEGWMWRKDCRYKQQLKCIHPFVSTFFGFLLKLGKL
jgi:hypothetical protein